MESLSKIKQHSKQGSGKRWRNQSNARVNLVQFKQEQTLPLFFCQKMQSCPWPLSCECVFWYRCQLFAVNNSHRVTCSSHIHQLYLFGLSIFKEKKITPKSASWRDEPFVVPFSEIWIFQIHMLLSALFLTCRSYRILKILNMFTLSIQQANGSAYQTVMHNSNQYPQACNSKSKLPLNKLGVTLTWIKRI